MLFTITAVSPEVEDFAIELQIESDATFADLHTLIRETCDWGCFKPATFYLCDHRWHRDRNIPEDSYEDDTMDALELGDFLEDEGQRMQYVLIPTRIAVSSWRFLISATAATSTSPPAAADTAPPPPSFARFLLRL